MFDKTILHNIIFLKFGLVGHNITSNAMTVYGLDSRLVLGKNRPDSDRWLRLIWLYIEKSKEMTT